MWLFFINEESEAQKSQSVMELILAAFAVGDVDRAVIRADALVVRCLPVIQNPALHQTMSV